MKINELFEAHNIIIHGLTYYIPIALFFILGLTSERPNPVVGCVLAMCIFTIGLSIKLDRIYKEVKK